MLGRSSNGVAIEAPAEEVLHVAHGVTTRMLSMSVPSEVSVISTCLPVTGVPSKFLNATYVAAFTAACRAMAAQVPTNEASSAPAPRTAEAVADQLRERMISGTYPPGSRLPGRRVLAEEFGLADRTIGAAVHRLGVQRGCGKQQARGRKHHACERHFRFPERA